MQWTEVYLSKKISRDYRARFGVILLDWQGKLVGKDVCHDEFVTDMEKARIGSFLRLYVGVGEWRYFKRVL